MRTALPFASAVAAALFTIVPLTADAAEDPPAPAATKPAAAPAAKPATAPAAAAKPAATTPSPAAAKPAGAPAAPSPAKPAAAAPSGGTAATPAAAKPASAAPAATAAKPAGTAPAPTAAKPGTPAAPGTATAAKPGTPAAPGTAAAAKPGTPAAPGTPPAASPASAPVDPAQAHLTIAQAVAGIRGIGAIIATIEIMREGKPVQALHCELFGDKAPLAVANFIGLGRGLRQWKDPKSGQWVKKPLYDGNLLHRVVPEMLIQGGDPNCTGDPSCHGAPGFGDPGYTIADELHPELRFDRGGRLAMSNRGPGTSGSQFFITEREASWLNGGHTIFGQCDGIELITELSHVEAGSRDVPKAPLVIKRVTFARKGN